MRRGRAALVKMLAGMLLAGAAHPALAQRPADPSLARLDARTRAAVEQVIDSARRAGLPTEPLASKALEGIAKRAKGERIVGAVRAYAQALGRARATLGTAASPVELVAAAGALQAGADPAAVARVRAARGGESSAVPLVVLADLITRGVPAPAASAAVETLARTDASDAEFAVLRRDVVQDIVAGARPEGAAAARAQSMSAGRMTRAAAPGVAGPPR